MIETFGIASAPNVSFNPLPSVDPTSFDIYVGQIDVSTRGLEQAVCIGGPGNDYAAALASGLHGAMGASNHLYMTGAFNQDITFDNPNQGIQVFSSQGLCDIFACRFTNFDLMKQEATVAGGPWQDQGLAITDDGQHIGGFISESAVFDPLPPPSIPFPTTQFTGYGSNFDMKENAFIASPDYDNALWFAIDTVINNDTLDSQFMTMASGVCDDFYAVLNMGLHPRRIRVPYYNYDFNCFNYDQLGHYHFATLSRWHDNAPDATMIWEHSFWPPNPNMFLPAATRLIEDIEIAIDISTYTDPRKLDSTSAEVVFTGRFGNDISFPSVTGGGSNIFNGNWFGNYTQDKMSMFYAGMHATPYFTGDTIEFCLTHIDTLPITLDSAFWIGNNPLIDSLYYTGPGIMDTLNRIFAPPGLGYYPITVNYKFLGCDFESLAMVVHVTTNDFPKHPITNGTEYAEGLASEGISITEIAMAGGFPFSDLLDVYEHYYLAGRYYKQISFPKFDGSVITLTSPTANGEAAYVVCYSSCGAVWAANIDTPGDDFIENLNISLDPISDMPTLYATGTITGPFGAIDELLIQNSTGYPVPSSAVNNPAYQINAPGTLFGMGQKGIVLAIHPLTGEVNWVYLGGDQISERNRFHGAAVEKGYMAVVGDRGSGFTYQNGSAFSTALVGNNDPLLIILDGTGTCVNTSTPGTMFFGTIGQDHGDAVDMIYHENGQNDSITIMIAGQVYRASSFVQYNNYNTAVSNTLPTTVSGKDIFIGKHSYHVSTNTLNNWRFKTYDGRGDEDVRDIIMAPADGQGAGHYYFCGSFNEGLISSFGLLQTSGATDYDLYIASVDDTLGDRWFTQEGRNSSFTQESADALELKPSSDTRILCYGNIQEQTNRSFHFSSAGINSPSMLFGLGNPFRSDIFCVEFDKTGSLFDSKFHLPGNMGDNDGNDITLIDTSYVLAGTFRFLAPATLDFFDNTNNTQKSLLPLSTISDAYIARFNSTYGSYKSNAERLKDESNPYEPSNRTKNLSIYPNPSNGEIRIVFVEPFSGFITLRNSSGTTLDSWKISDKSEILLNLDIPSGVYMMGFYSNEHFIFEKIVIQ